MRKILPTLIAAALALALGACNRDDADLTAGTDATAPAETPAPAAEDVPDPAATPAVGSLVTAGVGDGMYLTDNAGRSLYILEGDDTGTRCVGDCLAAWPMVTGAMPVSGVPEVQGTLIGTTTRADGTVQVTYAGHPLYYFAEDTGAGQTNGRDIKDTWGSWYLVRPDGALLSADMSAAGSASTRGETTTTSSTLTPAETDADSRTEPPPADDGY
jgi:predicted lipoprotein with Yx(FWY)xxD motif